MVTTINAYSVSLGLDSSNYINSANLTRSETRALSRDIDATRTPMENFTREQRRLSEALNKGGIDIGTYNRLLDDKKKKYGLAEMSTLDYAKSLSGPLAIGLGVVAAGTTAAIASSVAFVSHLKETQNQIDEVADAAGKLGVQYNALIGLRFAAREAGGVEAGAVDVAIRKMQIALSKGSTAFAELGLNSEALKSSGAVSAFSQIADKMSQISDHADKLRIATEIFGKGGSEMVSTLDAGRDAIAESVDFMVKWNGLTDTQIQAVQDSNDAWDRIGVVIDGMSTKMAAEFAPAFLVVAENVLGVADGIKGIDEGMQFVVNTTAFYLGQLKDAAELLVAMPMIMTGLGGATGAALDFTSGQKAMEAVIQKRAELEKEAARNKTKQKTLDLEEDTSNIDKLQKEINDAASGRIEREERQRREMQNRLAQDALRKADEHFKKERDNALKLRDDIAKGPGGGIMADSNEAAKFMADQVNKALASDAVGVPVKPTDEQLLEEAARQRELLEIADAREKSMLIALEKIAAKPNQLERAR